MPRLLLMRKPLLTRRRLLTRKRPPSKQLSSSRPRRRELRHFAWTARTRIRQTTVERVRTIMESLSGTSSSAARGVGT
jgi:hypothetical protein